MNNCLNHCSKINVTEWQVVDIFHIITHFKKVNYFNTKDMA